MDNKIIKLAHCGTGGAEGLDIFNQRYYATLPASQYKDPPKVVVECKKIK